MDSVSPARLQSSLATYNDELILNLEVTRSPLQYIKNPLDALFQVESTDVESKDTTFVDQSLNHLRSKGDAIIFHFLVIMLCKGDDMGESWGKRYCKYLDRIKICLDRGWDACST